MYGVAAGGVKPSGKVGVRVAPVFVIPVSVVVVFEGIPFIH